MRVGGIVVKRVSLENCNPYASWSFEEGKVGPTKGGMKGEEDFTVVSKWKQEGSPDCARKELWGLRFAIPLIACK